MELRTHIGKTIRLGLAILGLVAVSPVKAVNRSWIQTSGTFDFNSAANWGGTLPGNGDSAFVGWTTGSQTITITNAASDVFIASSLSISNADTGRAAFMYIKGQTFLTNGVGTLIFGGALGGQPGNGNQESISLAFSNNVTLNQATFTGSGENGSATLTFAGGTLRGSNLTFNANDAGTWNQLTIANETVNLSSNFTMTAGDNSDITLITNSTVTVAGKLSVAGDTSDQYFILSNSTLTVSNGVLNTGRIDLLNRGTLNVTKDWTNNSVVNLGGGNIVGGVLTNQANGTVVGFGAVSNLVNGGIVGASNGELQIVGAASGTGSFRAVSGSGTLTFAGGGSISALFNTNATVKLTSALTNNNTFVNEGTLILNVGTYQSTANLTNAAGETIISSDDGTINAAGVINRGTILTTNANLVISNLVVQGGTVTIGNGGSLALVGAGALTNFGTINLAGAAGAGNNAVLNLGSAVLTNLSGGTITGGGIIQNASQVVNLNGGSILATSTVVELQFTNANTVGNAGTMGAGSGATLTFGAAGVGNAIITNYGTINLAHGTLRSGSITNLANGFFGGTGVIVAAVVNQGRMNFSGTLSNGLQNSGSLVLNDDTTIVSNLVVNSGGTLDLVGNNLTNTSVLVINSGGGLTNGVAGAIVTGSVSNNGKIFLSQNATFGGPVTNTGGFFFQGTINNNLVNSGSGSITLNNTSTITGTANVNAGTFNLNGQTYTNGLMVVSSTGVLTNGIAGASFSGGLSNDATVAVTANTFFKGPVTNTGDFFFQGAISNGLNNSSSLTLNNNATITGPLANTGTIDASGSVLTVNPAWANSGTVLVDGGTVAGGNLTNNSTLSGPGTISSLLVNNGQVQVSGGTLNVTQAPVQNGTVNVSSSGALNVTPAWQNSGLVNINAGGTVAGGNLTNAVSGTITNNGFVTASLINQGRVSLSGVISNTVFQTAGSFTVNGNSTITGNTTINGGTLNLLGNRLSNNLLIVGGTGVVTNDITGATINGGVSNSATIAFTAGTFLNGTVTNLGGFFFEGAISNNLVNNGGTFVLNDDSTITGTATINAGQFNLNGNNYSNRLMVLGGTGVLTNGIAGATFNGGLSNDATVSLTANTYFNGPVTNMSAMFFEGAISNSLVNNGSFNLNDDSTLTAAPVNNGTISIGANTLTVVPAWANAGSLQIGGGVLAGGTVTNNSGEGFLGFGTVSNQVVNNGTLTASGGTLTLVLAPINNGTAIVANASVLNVLPAWTNTGVLSNAPTGALSGGTLTNSGTINGAGFINPEVVNQGRMNFGGTISNTFLQTAGSFTVNGGATITGGATINGGVVDLFGNRLNTGQLLVGNNGTLSNSVAGASFSGVISNAGTVGFAVDAFISSAVTNTGTWTQRGAISNSVNNSGTMTVFAGSGNSRITGGVLNSGSLTFDSGAPVFLSGAVTNTGSFAFNGAISNNLVNSGSIILNNTATVTGTASITAGIFNLNGKNYSNGLTVVSNTGVLTNGIAGASFSGGLSNDATVVATASTFFKGPVTNTGDFFFQGAISNGLNNSSSFSLNNNGTITGPVANTGTIDASGDVLTVNPAWANSGTILVDGGTVAGGNLTNNSTLSGPGTISSVLVNNGQVVVSGGTLTITQAPVQNGTVSVSGSSALNVTPAWQNSGLLNVNSGGTVAGGAITNASSGTITNNGFVTASLINQGQLNLNGVISNTVLQTAGSFTINGNSTITGNTTINGGTLNLLGNRLTNNLLIVGGTSVVTNGVVGATLNGGVSNSATIAFTASTFLNGTVTNLGGFFFEGAISNNLVNNGGTFTLNDDSTITGTATINAGQFNLNGNNYSNRLMVLGGTGVLTNGIAGATFNGGLSNDATVSLTANTYFNGPVTNTGSFFLQGAVSNNFINTATATLTINNNATITGLLANFAGNQVNINNGTLQLFSGPTQNGTLTIAANGALSVPTAWANSGAILINGGAISSGNLTNNSAATLGGFGTISGAVINSAGALITASGGKLALLAAPVQNGGILVNGNGVLAVTPDWSSSGTINIAAGGAITGGNLTNTSSSGTLSGSGFIDAFLVNEGRMNFGGTISNNFLQTAGSFTLSGGATITGAATINGGTLDLAGNQLTDGSLLIAASALLTNGVQNASINGGITNAGLVNLFRDTYINGPVTNTGTWIQRGAISNSVVNSGVMTLLTNSINVRVTGSIVNSGSLTFDTNGTVYVSGVVSNSGSFSFSDVISNNLVNTAGGLITLSGAGTVTGNTTINGGTLNLNGQSFTDALMVVSGTGILTNGVANGALGGGLSNANIVAVTANTFFKGPVTNTGTFQWQGAISNTFVNSGTAKLNNAGTITGNASITAGSFDLNGQALSSSLMVISSGAVLTNSTAGASVSGAINLQNAVVSGQSVNNDAVLSGSGTISAPLNNTAAGVITANGGLLTITGALTQNGTIDVAAASTLDIVPAFSNSGSLNMQGGFLVGGNINNTAGDNISGFGIISNAIANAGLITASGGSLTLVIAPTTQTGSGINVASGGTLNVLQDWADNGTLTVSGTLIGGTVTNIGGTGTLSGSGTINTFVVNQGRMNWGGTINNSLLQTAGSLTLSGNATITGNATINAGGMDLVNNLFTVGQLTINNSATLQNTGNIGTINGAVVNNGTVNFNVNDSFDDSSVAINGQVVNNGTWTEAGTINGTLVNTGSFDWTSHTYFFGFDQEASPLLNGGITNTGSLTFDPSYVARVNGSVTNSGAINFNGTATGNLWQTSGTFTLNGAGTISGPANVAGGSFNLNGQSYNGSTMVVSGTGDLTNAVAGANFNSGLSNAANVGVTANAFFKGPVTNTGTFAFLGAVSNTFANSGDVILNGSGTISGTLANSGSVNVNSGTLSLVVAPTQTGSITVANGATLNVAQAWINNGTITLLGGSVTNATLTNNGFITGFGTVDGGGVVNNGKVFANASSISGIGTQTVRLTSFTNNNSATLGTASTNAVLNLLTTGNALINQGTISLSGGTILFNGGAGTITNYNIIAGVGNVASFPIVNTGTLASFVAQAPVSGLSNLIATIGVTNNGLLGANNFINGAATLSLSVVGGGAAIVNQGTVALQGGFLTINGGSGIITNVNNGLIYGAGTQGFQVANLATGTIMASNGVFEIGLQSNANAGVLSNKNAASTLLLTNKFLVNTGRIVLNGGGLLLGGSVITNEATITGPGALSSSLYNDTAGSVLITNGVLNVATNSGESVQNLGLFTITGDGTLNVVPAWLNTNGTVNIAGGGITGGAVTNIGLVSGFGTISSQFVNLAGGTLTAGAGSLTLLTAPTQNGSVNITGTGTLNVLQSWLNSGSVNLQGGSLVGSTITNSGAISGFGSITPLVRNNTGGTITANGGTLTLSIAPNQLGTVVISNAATLNVLQAWQNSGTLNMAGGTDIGSTLANASTIAGFGTITPQVQNNSGATLTASAGTLTLTVAPTQAGTLVVANGGTLNVLQAWQNSGLLSMAGGTAIGSAITNASSVNGFGTITPQVINKTTGTITANGGTLTLSVAPNQLGGVVVSNAATLNVLQAWQNSGVMSVRGGTVIGSVVTNTVNVNGFGTITPQVVNNSGATLTASAGTLTLTLAPVQNGTVVATNGGTLNVLAAWQNSGTVAFLGGDIIGATVTNTGTMTGFGGVQNVLNNSHVFVSNGVWHVSGSLVQNGTVDVAANSRLDVTPIWANAGSVLIDGGFTSGGTMTNTTAGLLRGFGTVSNTVVNQGTILATNGTLNLISAPTQSGTITVANAATLNVAQAWQNGGSVNVQGGSVVGAQLTNAGSIGGSGTISSSLINNSGATITASSGGTLTLTGAPIQNGTVNILGALNVVSAWSNGSAGTVNLNGGALTGGMFTVNGTVGGNGTIAANMVIGGKTVTVSGGQMNLTALTTIDGGMINGGTLANYGTISGDGTISSTLSNAGYVRATNGVLSIQTLAGNQTTGTLEASLGGSLAVNGSTPWVNNGHVLLSGGTILGGDISNNVSKNISGFGTINPNVYNSGQILANNSAQPLTFNNSLANLSGGVIMASSGNLIVNGTFTNSGTLSMLHSVGTFVSSVVNSGAWITDPSTNVFQSTYTVTSSGFVQSSAGDTYIFTNNGSQVASFVNQSTQSNAFNTLGGKFVFDATLSLTQTFFTAGNNIGNLDTNGGFDFTLVGSTNGLPQYQDNFALGDLEIGSTTLVADASVDGGRDNDGLESALFLDDLTLDAGAHLVISNDVQVYFINSNAFNVTQVTLLGNAGLHQLTTDASLVIPEPSIVLLWMSSFVTVYAARRRNARSTKKNDSGSQPRG